MELRENSDIDKDGKVTEPFCPVCIVGLPMLIAGSGATAYGSSNGDTEANKTNKFLSKKNIYKLGLALIALALAIGIYYLVLKPCSDCI